MSIPLPNLDDRTFAELVEEAISQIPQEYPEWTDHNPTDTGIILIELLAWLTDMTLYRVNQIPDENYASFISLLQGTKWDAPTNTSARNRQKYVQSEIEETLSDLRRRYRAVTAEDYEQLILNDWNELPECDLKIARVKCLPQRNLSESDANTFVTGNVSLVIVPEPTDLEDFPIDTTELFDFIEQRKILTTFQHIVTPEYIYVAIDAGLVVEDSARSQEVLRNAVEELRRFFSPLESGKYWEGKGWPFGQSVYLSELYKVLHNLEGVDYVKELTLKDEKNNSNLEEISLADNQLVNFNLLNSTFTIYNTSS